MQGGQLIDSGHARVPCDLCCAQASALAMPACKWASGVCMRCAWFSRHPRSPLQADLSSAERGWMVPQRQCCLRRKLSARSRPYGPSTSPFLPGMFVGRRPKAKSDEFGDVDTLGTPVLRYKGVVLFFIKDFTGCVTLIGSTTR